MPDTCRARRFVYVSTAGGPMPPRSCGFEYVKALNDVFLGIPETVFLYADGLDIAGNDPEKLLASAMSRVDETALSAR